MAKRCSAHYLTKLAPSALGLLCAGALFAQQIPAPPSPPAPPTVSAPTVSPVTAPTLGSLPTGPAGSASGAAAGSGSANTALAMSSLLGDSSASLLSSLLGEDTDTTGAADDELLGKLMSLLQGGSGATAAAAASAGKASASAERSSASASRVGVASVGAGNDGGKSASGADIARFALGAYDVTPTITLLLSSNIAANGAFLLSGDRAYLSSGKTLRETFYFLCRKEADGSYVLHADVAQETANEWSACRRLARLGAIRGEQAGNQILFRASDSVGPIYLLLSLFGPSAGR